LRRACQSFQKLDHFEANLQVKPAHGGLSIVLQPRVKKLGKVHEVEVDEVIDGALAGDKWVARRCQDDS
jgi:hypothetical protein